MKKYCSTSVSVSVKMDLRTPLMKGEIALVSVYALDATNCQLLDPVGANVRTSVHHAHQVRHKNLRIATVFVESKMIVVSHQLVFKEEKDRNVINPTAFLVKVSKTDNNNIVYFKNKKKLRNCFKDSQLAKIKSRFLTCPCNKIYRVGAVCLFFPMMYKKMRFL